MLGLLGRNLNLGAPVAANPLNDWLAGFWLGLPNNSGGTQYLDLTGRYPGTLANGPAWSSDRVTGFAALSFTAASSQNVAVGSMGTFTDVTLEWAQAGANASSWPIAIAGGALGIQIGATSVRYRGHTVDVTTSGTPAMSDGTWRHVVVSVKANNVTNGSEVFVDGKSYGTFTATGATQSLGNVKFGSRDDNVEYWSGTLGFVRIYSAAVGSLAPSLYDQWLRGFPGTLARTPRRVAAVAAAAPSTGVTAVKLAGRPARLAGAGGLAG